MIVAVMFVGAVAVKATPAAADCAATITTTLRVGSAGVQVQCLQTIVGATADGAFGPMTKASVMAWQAGHGLVADGVVGPMTRAALMGAPTGNFPAGCTSASGYSSTTGMACTTGPSAGLPAGCSTTAGYSPLTGAKCDSSTPAPDNGGALEGGAGSITVTALSTYGDEQVGEDEEDVKLAAFEVEADNGSDVDLTSMKIELNQQNTADSEDVTDYMDSVSVWMGTEKVGEVDAADFSESTGHVWTKSVSLDGAIVRAGDTEKFYLAVTALPNLDSGDMDSDDWQIGVSNVRFLDAEGVVTTESLTLDIDDNVIDDTIEEEFDFASFATASDVELKVALKTADDEINEAHVIDVETGATDTEDVELLSFTMKAVGSDLNVQEIPVLFTTTETTGDDPDDIIVRTSLWLEGAEIASESFLTTDGNDSLETITFDGLDVDINSGDTVEFMVKVDLQDLTGALDAGDTVMADLTATEVDLIVAEDSSGEELVAADLTGTANGEASEVRDVGINVKLVGSPTAVISHVGDIVGSGAGDDDQGTFEIVFDVTAFDGDVYIDGTSPTLTGAGALLDLNLSETGTHALTSATITSPSGATMSGVANADARFLVAEGTTERFKVTAVVVVSVDGFASIAVADIVYALTNVTGTTSYTFNLADFKTTDLYMNAN